jgi:hypothetical protein
LKPEMVSFKDTYLPAAPVNTSATKNGWERKRWILRAQQRLQRNRKCQAYKLMS